MGIRRTVCKACNTSKIVTTSSGVGASTRVDHGSRSDKMTIEFMWGYVTGSSRSESSKLTGEAERPVNGDCLAEGWEHLENHPPLLGFWGAMSASWEGATVTSKHNGGTRPLYDTAG